MSKPIHEMDEEELRQADLEARDALRKSLHEANKALYLADDIQRELFIKVRMKRKKRGPVKEV